MITNHYLFSSQFRTYLQAQQLEDEEFFGGFKDTVSSFLQSAAHDHLDYLTRQVAAPILNQLQFAHAPFTPEQSGPPAAYSYLYDGFPLENRVSCVYVTVPPPAPHPQPLSQGERGAIHPLPLGEGRGEGARTGARFPAQKGSFPAFELIYRLKQAGLEWGILTDGVAWRLYSTRAPLPYEQFLEIDFSDPRDEDFRVFWQLFSLTLFLPDEHDVTPLQTYIEESAKEAEVIEQHIKNNIEEILENICVGLITYGGRDARPLSDAEQQIYFENAVYLLFRLLFVLYAESRDLLPVRNPAYRECSLQALLRQAREWLRGGVANPDGTELWDAFRDLCTHIEGGDRALGIPEYDGGLFDSREHAFLSDASNKVTNLYFVKVLYRLGYRNVGKRSKSGVQSSLCDQAIEYRDLSVRSLGSLYEGILEYTLFIAEEELVVRKKQILPAREAGKIKKSERVIAPGQVYFAQAANERHDTGSYYTPEYVVEYMVQNSVRVGLEERWQAFQPTLAQYAREVRRASSGDLRQALLKKLDQELLRFVEEQALTFKVVDPAMGSGHFLVNALNTITHFILDALQARVSPHPGPLPQRAREKNDFPSEKAQGLAMKGSLSPLPEREPEIPSWEGQGWVYSPLEGGQGGVFFPHHNPAIDLTPAAWRRKVVERCIFGVDINPLAAELAKLSLWIASADAGKPLTFLNHHLKCGNSLIGAQLKDIGRYPLTKKTPKDDGQLTFLERDKGFQARVQEALAALDHITSQDSGTIETVGSKKTWLQQAEAALAPYKALCDAHTSLFFGNAMSHDDYDRMLLDFTPGFTWNGARFFHWELEFPEAMLREDGFNAVIGNPPYGAKLQMAEKKFIIQNGHCFEGNFDIYTAFIELGFNRTSSNGYWSYILPVSWQTGSNYIKVREYLKDNGMFKVGLKLPYNVFQDAYIGTGIYVVQKKILSEYQSKVYEFPIKHNLNKGFANKINYNYLSNTYWQTTPSLKIVFNPIYYELLHKVVINSIKLGDISNSVRGIIPNKTDVYEERLKDDLKKYFVGNIYRYFNSEEFNWVLYGENLKESPKDYSYFYGKRILIRRLINRQFRIMATYAVDEFVNKKDIYNIKISIPEFNEGYLLAIINSKLISYLKTKGSTIATKDDFSQLTLTDIREIPIKEIPLDTQYLFSDLSQKFLTLNKNSYQEIQDSLSIIETNSPSGKRFSTSIQKFYTLPSFHAVLQELEKQKVILKPEDETTLHTLFDKIQALNTEIHHTDDEIDRMVYDLYGLTAEEIAVVEGEEN